MCVVRSRLLFSSLSHFFAAFIFLYVWWLAHRLVLLCALDECTEGRREKKRATRERITGIGNRDLFLRFVSVPFSSVIPGFFRSVSQLFQLIVIMKEFLLPIMESASRDTFRVYNGHNCHWHCKLRFDCAWKLEEKYISQMFALFFPARFLYHNSRICVKSNVMPLCLCI